MKSYILISILNLITVCLFAQDYSIIKSVDGFSLNAKYYNPNKPGNGILFLHQCNRKGELIGFESLAENLIKQGIHSLLLDFRGFGKSRNQEYHDFHQQMDQTEAHFPDDVESAYQFLVENSGMNRIQVVSASCGVTQAILLAQNHSGIKSIVMLSGGFDNISIMEEKVNQLQIPVLIVYTEEDRYGVPESMSRAFIASKNENSKLIKLKGNLHGTHMFGQAAWLEDEIIQWLGSS